MPEPRLMVSIRHGEKGAEYCVSAPDGPVTIEAGQAVVLPLSDRSCWAAFGMLFSALRTQHENE